MTDQRIVVIGAGMVAQRFVEALADRDGSAAVTVVGEEPHAPYDRVALTSYFTGGADALALGDPGLWERPGVQLVSGVAATAIDRDRRTVTLADGRELGYDALVLATGSRAFVPPVPGSDLINSFVYRTIDDVRSIEACVHELAARLDRPVRGAVIGGGLLGLEAAGALRAMNAEATVIEFAPRLMPLQVDEGGGAELARIIAGLGVDVRTGTATKQVLADDAGAVRALDLGDAELDADLVIFATGVRPRDELARDAGLAIGERGGAVVDAGCRTSDPAILAIGEVACIGGAVWGLIAPGNAMAEIAVDRLLGGQGTFPGADTSAKLKLLGVDVASFGDAFATTPGALEVVHADPVTGRYGKLVVSDDARTLLGGILVGDASAYPTLRPLLGTELSADPSAYLVGGTAAPGSEQLPDAAAVCSCNNVTAGTVRAAVSEHGCTDLAAVKGCTKAGTSCGSCLPLVKRLVETELAAAGIEVSRALCEHFALGRAELFEAVRLTGLGTFSEIIARHGRGGRGCDICKPVVASILASLGNGHILSGEQGALQDTNDHMLANLQKDGSYSVVPRIPGGEITPDGLITIGEVAREFGLYTKITGGQRIDLFGARVEQLPQIWRRLVEAGFESGHAYGKALRTVKSCVGSTWCRYGVQDSVAMAIRLELRYRGLRAPHKIKLGVSGCARECAEARGKDVGVIATDKGWNLYLGGNGGFSPKHAQLFAEDLDDDGLITLIDRFLIYYVRTADRLQRTAGWLESLDGGLDRLREVIVDDRLGVAADLDAAMAAHVAGYRDEWGEVLDDPDKLARFGSFVNAAQTPDPDLAYVGERGQRRPATPAERAAAASGGLQLITPDREPVLISDSRLPTRRKDPQ